MANGHLRSIFYGDSHGDSLISPYVSLISPLVDHWESAPRFLFWWALRIWSRRWVGGMAVFLVTLDVLGDTGIAPTILWHVNRGEWWPRSTQKSRINDRLLWISDLPGNSICTDGWPNDQVLQLTDPTSCWNSALSLPTSKLCSPGTLVEHLWNTCGTLVEHLWNTCGTLVEHLWNTWLLGHPTKSDWHRSRSVTPCMLLVFLRRHHMEIFEPPNSWIFHRN